MHLSELGHPNEIISMIRSTGERFHVKVWPKRSMNSFTQFHRNWIHEMSDSIMRRFLGVGFLGLWLAMKIERSL